MPVFPMQIFDSIDVKLDLVMILNLFLASE